MESLIAALLLGAGYNSAVATVGATFLGAAGGVVGTFLLLRRRVMLADAASHATLPGLVLAFLAGLSLFGEGRILPLLLLGAALSAALGGLAVHAVAATRRIGEDAAIASVLAAFYGAGTLLLSYVQSLPVGGRAGLERFLLGSAAGTLRTEAELVAGLALLFLLLVLLLTKELRLLCFDPGFAEAHGWSTARLDLLLTGLLLAFLVIGLQIVGSVLALALVVLPPAAARLWADRLGRMLPLAAAIGALSGWLGAAFSAALQRLPTGPAIVLVGAVLFFTSLLVAPRRGVVAVAVRRARLRRTLGRGAASGPLS
jgi:manganese/zinc/iron transport system permease protein